MVRDGLHRATLAGLAGRDGGVSAAEGKAEADQAMTLLRKAVGIGYRDPVAFRTDSALDPLRQREDFQKLLQELEQKSAAKPEKKPSAKRGCCSKCSGLTLGPGSARPWENDSKSVRHFSPGWGIEIRACSGRWVPGRAGGVSTLSSRLRTGG